MNPKSFTIYNNSTFNITINMPPGAAPQTHPHADGSQWGFPQSADDFDYLMQQAMNAAMQGMEFIPVAGSQSSHSSHPEPAPAPAQTDNLWANNFDDFHVPNHHSSGTSTGAPTVERYDFQGPSMPETPRWIPSAASLLFQSPQSYSNAPLPTGFEQEDQFNTIFNAPQVFSAAQDTPQLDSLGLFPEPSSDMLENSLNRMGDSLFSINPAVSGILNTPWPVGGSHHSDFEYPLEEANSALNTPAPAGSHYSGSSSYEGSASSEWDSSSIGSASVPPTPLTHDAFQNFQNDVPWDSSWSFTPLEESASKPPCMGNTPVDDWAALMFGPHVGMSAGNSSAY